MTAPIIHGIMLQAGIMLQTGTSSATSTSVTGLSTTAVNQLINQIGVPIFDAMLAVGGFSFLIVLAYFIAHLVRYKLHPTSWGRSAALSEAIYHIERLIYIPLLIFLGIYLFLFFAGLASGQHINAAYYAGQVLGAMLNETINVLNTAIHSALSTTT